MAAHKLAADEYSDEPSIDLDDMTNTELVALIKTYKPGTVSHECTLRYYQRRFKMSLPYPELLNPED